MKRILPNRAIIRLTGPDMLHLLGRTVTNSVDNWQTGEMRYGALLTPQGKVIADYLAMLALENIYIDVHADAADDLEDPTSAALRVWSGCQIMAVAKPTPVIKGCDNTCEAVHRLLGSASTSPQINCAKAFTHRASSCLTSSSV